ncbi:hypothetical protein [Allocoleopsis sp.]
MHQTANSDQVVAKLCIYLLRSPFPDGDGDVPPTVPPNHTRSHTLLTR